MKQEHYSLDVASTPSAQGFPSKHPVNTEPSLQNTVSYVYGGVHGAMVAAARFLTVSLAVTVLKTLMVWRGLEKRKFFTSPDCCEEEEVSFPK